ncbi:hypothetical protein MOKP107_49580 [Mycobacterium avium subsp. hominissuis]
MLGDQRRGVRRCECDTALPKLGRRPVTWQSADTKPLPRLLKIIFDKARHERYRMGGLDENDYQ